MIKTKNKKFQINKNIFVNICTIKTSSYFKKKKKNLSDLFNDYK